VLPAVKRRAVTPESGGKPMVTVSKGKRALIEGRPALIVIDIQAGTFDETIKNRAIAHMPGYAARMARSRLAIDKARTLDIPVVFIQEVHRPDLIDFGRELDGDEDIHCLEDNPNTEIAVAQTGFRPNDYLIRKRRYSAFFGTDFEILLKGLKAETLLLCGGLTDVCVHYTFVDGHQSDYHCRVIEDCVAGSSEDAHEHALRAMEYLQAGARRSLDEVLDAMETYRLAEPAAVEQRG
jgi:nicotinamidase-related amidase